MTGRNPEYYIAPSTATLSRSRQERHFDEVVPSRSCSIDSGHYFHAVLPYDWPEIGADDDHEFSATQLLLVTDVWIGG
ncbi:MAG: hypothetical protein DMG39_09460 [Acidobacteria bacterium]|nr:MAG: hypothetical protein DMG39_09460 [Acidobacteriota bacterium]